MNEYCRNLGVLDDQTVPAEHASYEDFSFARFSVVDDKWVCYHDILTGDGVAARSATCFDNEGQGSHQDPRIGSNRSGQMKWFINPW